MAKDNEKRERLMARGKEFNQEVDNEIKYFKKELAALRHDLAFKENYFISNSRINKALKLKAHIADLEAIKDFI